MRRLAIATALLAPSAAWAAGDTGHALSLLFFASINFVLYVALLYFLLRKPTREFIAARYQQITHQLDRVAREREALAEQRRAAEARKAKLADDAAALEADVVRSAEADAQRKLTAAQGLAKSIAAGTEQRIAGMERAATERILADTATHLVDQAGEAATAKMDAATNQKIAGRMAQELGLNVSATIVARRYAAALLAACEDKQADAAAVLAELKPWAEWLKSDDHAARALLSPVLKPSDQAGLLDKLLEAEGSSDLAKGFLKLALSKRRLDITEEIVAEAQTELDRASGTVRGEAASAFALDDELKSKITTYVAGETGRKPSLTWHEDPELIGGFVVRVGDRVWDASLRKQLNRLGETIRKGVR